MYFLDMATLNNLPLHTPVSHANLIIFGQVHQGLNGHIRQGGFCQVPLPYMRLDRGHIRGWGHEFQVKCGDLFHGSILFFIWIEYFN